MIITKGYININIESSTVIQINDPLLSSLSQELSFTNRYHKPNSNHLKNNISKKYPSKL